MMSGCSKSAAAHPLRVRERELDFRFEGYAGTMNRKGQGTSLAGADDRPKRSDFRAIPGGVGEGARGSEYAFPGMYVSQGNKFCELR